MEINEGRLLLTKIYTSILFVLYKETDKQHMKQLDHMKLDVCWRLYRLVETNRANIQ